MSTAILSILALVDSSNSQGAALEGLGDAVRIALHGRASGLNETFASLKVQASDLEKKRTAKDKARQKKHDPLTGKFDPAPIEGVEYVVRALMAAVTAAEKSAKVASLARPATDWKPWEGEQCADIVMVFNLAYEKALDQVAAFKAEKAAESKAKKATEKAEADRLAALEAAQAIDDHARAENLGQLAKSAAFDPMDVCKTLEARALMGDDAALSAIALLIEHLQTAGVLALDEVAA